MTNKWVELHDGRFISNSSDLRLDFVQQTEGPARHGFLDEKLPYDGQDRSQDLGGSSPVQEDGNRGKGW
jgi:hypothetical protein